MTTTKGPGRRTGRRSTPHEPARAPITQSPVVTEVVTPEQQERRRLARVAASILSDRRGRGDLAPFRGSLAEAVDALAMYALADCPGGRMPNRSDIEAQLQRAATYDPGRVAQLFACALLRIATTSPLVDAAVTLRDAEGDDPIAQAWTDFDQAVDDYQGQGWARPATAEEPAVSRG